MKVTLSLTNRHHEHLISIGKGDANIGISRLIDKSIPSRYTSDPASIEVLEEFLFDISGEGKCQASTVYPEYISYCEARSLIPCGRNIFYKQVNSIDGYYTSRMAKNKLYIHGVVL